MGEEVELDGDVGLAVTLDEGEQSVGRALVIIGGQDKRGRRIGGNDIRNAERTGINEKLEIGSGVLAVNGVGGVRIGRVVVVGDHRDEFAAGGKAEDSDAVGIDVPFGGAAPDEPHGTDGILRASSMV